MKHVKTVEEKYQKLDDISHVLLRPGRYLGSVNPHTAMTYWVDGEVMSKGELTWCPALIKTFDEIISNSVDFSKTEDGKHLNTIKVTIDQNTGELAVHDNGGIVVVKHSEHNQWIPELIFELKAGSNFNDDQEDLTGQNGEGAALTVIFSESFSVKTADGKNSFQQTHVENARKKSEPKIAKSTQNYTHIEWVPDYAKFNLPNGLDEGNYKKLVKRVYDVAGCNPKLKIFLNGKHIKINSFDDYIKMYTTDYAYDENDDWKVGIGTAPEGFEHISFVNGTETIIGGTHILYIMNQITDKLREYFKKKHKVDVKPSDMRNHVQLFVNAKVALPRYSSQTKEDLITEVKMYKTSWECSDKFIKKVLTLEVVQSILDWVKVKEQAMENAELRKLNKTTDKADPKSILKFHDATSRFRRETSVFFVEGDSALSGVLSGRDSKIHGAYPLRGVPLNVYEMDVKDVVNNKEFKNIMIILGLQLGVKVTSPNDLRFGKIIFTTDQDLDGYHIRGLLMNMLYKYWPELFKLGMIYILNTPLVKVTQGKKVTSFYSNEEFEAWQEAHKGEKFSSKYYKGLGTASSKEWKQYFTQTEMDNNLIQLVIEDEEDAAMFKLLFSKEKGMTDERKNWLQISETVL